MDPSKNKPMKEMKNENNINVAQSTPESTPKCTESTVATGGVDSYTNYIIYIIKNGNREYKITRIDYLILKEIYESRKNGKIIHKGELKRKLVDREKLITKSTFYKRINILKDAGIIKEIKISNGVIELHFTPFGIKLYEEVLTKKILESTPESTEGGSSPHPSPHPSSKEYLIHYIVVKIEFLDDLLPYKLLNALRVICSSNEEKIVELRKKLGLGKMEEKNNPKQWIIPIKLRINNTTDHIATLQIIEKSDGTLTYQAFIPSFVVKEEELTKAPEEYKKRRDLLISKLVATLSLVSYLFAGEKNLEDKIYIKVPKIREKISSKLRYNEIEWDPEPWRIEIAREIIEEHKKKYGEELRSFEVNLNREATGIDNSRLGENAWIRFESYQGEHKVETNSYDIAEKTRSERLAEAYAKIMKLYGKETKIDENLKKEALLRGDSLIVETTELMEATINDLKELIKMSLINQYIMSENLVSHVSLVQKIEKGLSSFIEAVNKYNQHVDGLKRELWLWRVISIIQWLLLIILILLKVI